MTISYAHNPYGQYQQQKKSSIENSDRVTIIAKLLEGAICYNKKALLALENSDKKSALEFIVNGVNIVNHLYSCLNFDDGGDVADQLGRLYNYMSETYVAFQRDLSKTEYIYSINTVLETLLVGWNQIPRQLKGTSS